MLFCPDCHEGERRCLCVDANGLARYPENWQRLVGRQPNPDAIAQGIQKASSGRRARRAWETALESGGTAPASWRRSQPARKASQRKAGAAPERDVLKLLQDAAALAGVTLLRNNVGALQDAHGRWVTYGLGLGSPDLVGWRTVTVTPEMVGQRLAVFVGIEAKREAGGIVSERQARYLERLHQAGAIAGVCRSTQDLAALLETRPHVVVADPTEPR